MAIRTGVMILWLMICCQLSNAQTPLSLEVEQITSGDHHHFFGYIGQSLTTPWNASGRYLLTLRTTFHDRMPSATDAADVCLVDAQGDYKVVPVEQTTAWNFQQGTMFYWHPKHPETQFFFNDRDPKTNLIFTVLYDIEKKQRIREYRFDEVPVANGGVSPTGEFFLAINYARMARLRPVTGYPETADQTERTRAPSNDGIYRVDIASGKRKLLVSFAQLKELLRDRHAKIDEVEFYINHSLSSRDGKLVYFYARGRFGSKSMAVNVPCSVRTDGTDLKSHEFIGGHPEWDLGHVVVGAIHPGRQVRYDIDQSKVIGEIGKQGDFPNPEGDVSVGPNGKWFVNGYSLNDRKDIKYIVMRRSDGAKVESPLFSRGPYQRGELRIDPAPRWNRDATQILVPGMTKDGTRQLHLLKVKERKAKKKSAAKAENPKTQPTSKQGRLLPATGLLYEIDNSRRRAPAVRRYSSFNDLLDSVTLKGGDTVQVRATNRPYNEAIELSTGGSTRRKRNGTDDSGSPQRYLTIESHPENGARKPVIDGSGLRISTLPSTTIGLVELTNTEWVRFRGFRIVNSQQAGVTIRNTDHPGSARTNHIILEDCEIANCRTNGIVANAKYVHPPGGQATPPDEIVIRNNTVTSVCTAIFDMKHPGGEAITVTNCTHFKVYGNQVRNDNKEGIAINNGAMHGEVYNNLIEARNPKSRYGRFRGTGIYVDGAHLGVDDIQVFGNVVRGRVYGISVASESGGDVGRAHGILVYNNVVYDCIQSCFAITGNSPKELQSGLRANIKVFHNTFVGDDSPRYVVTVTESKPEPFGQHPIQEQHPRPA